VAVVAHGTSNFATLRLKFAKKSTVVPEVAGIAFPVAVKSHYQGWAANNYQDTKNLQTFQEQFLCHYLLGAVPRSGWRGGRSGWVWTQNPDVSVSMGASN
jgi:hypothetical protein